jgi:hypothetical protein
MGAGMAACGLAGYCRAFGTQAAEHESKNENPARRPAWWIG